MNHQEITNGLLQLGFNSGWVVNGDEIVLWENSEPKPNEKAITDAAKLWDKTQKAEAQAKAAARQAVLDRLGLTAEEAKLLLGGN
jgi:hypothetical protein